MNLKSQIEGARGDAAGLERLYKQALVAGNEAAFKEAIGRCAGEHPENVLFSAWAYRLDVLPPPPLVVAPEGQTVNQSQSRRWWTAVATSVVLGVVYALFARDRPPIPIPGEADPLFWIGWGPLTALGILFYLVMVDRSERRIYRYAGLAVIPIAVYTAVTAWSRTDDIAILSALHLPFVAWAAIGTALTLGHPDPARQCYAYLVKSAETVLVGGIYFAAGAIFLGLTYGIFAVLGINLPQDVLQTVAAWGIGAIPVLALASVYDPMAAPVAQDWTTGLTRILRILTQLILPLALGVLVVYIFWFVPAYFWRPFQEREVLIVYNATILAILVLLTVVVSGPVDERSPRQDTILRYAVQALVGLILFLNVYALAAIASRTFNFGLTPNRYAVFGWNIVTLLMLAVVGIRQWRGRSDPWVYIFRESIARVSVLAVAWALWVLIGLPLSFD
ncbi:DUF687 domain-containing protein [candidate division KSB1 bacterium]|nr:DUF687 domain-containing protein [candidate division KSB1 bacterium]